MTIDSIAAQGPVTMAQGNSKLQKSAREFEAMLLADLMKLADSQSGEADATGQGYDDMRVQAVAQGLAEHGGIGIAQLLLNQLHGAVEEKH